MYLITALVTIWALRLAIYLGIRKKGLGEDYRYKNWREGWEKGGTLNYYLISYFFVCNMSAVFVNIYSKDNNITWTDYTGTVVWVLGVLIEALSDAQLARHLANPEPGSGKFLKTGL